MNDTAATGTALRRGVGRVVLLYAGFSAVWILLSDASLEVLLDDPFVLSLAGAVKGWLFVLVSSLLLYYGLGRLIGRTEPVSAMAPARHSFRVMALAVAVVVAICAGAIQHSRQHHQRLQSGQMEAIAQAKAERLGLWLHERQGVAGFVRTSRYFAEMYLQWRNEGIDQARGRLQSRMEDLRQAWGFHGIVLFDPDGRLLWMSDEAYEPLPPELAGAIEGAAASREVVRAGPFRDGNANARMDFVVPLISADQPPLIVLQAAPDDWLKPALRDWSLQGEVGEMLLTRSNGGRVETFRSDFPPNRSQDRPTPATSEGQSRRPPVRGGMDAAQAEVTRSIPGTDWMLVIRPVTSSASAEVLKESFLIVVGGMLLLSVIAVVLLLQRQRQELAIAKAVQHSQDQRLRTLQLLDAISDASEDAIFAKDQEGRYLLFNRAASTIVGKTAEQVLGHNDRSLFPSHQSQQLMEADRQILEEGRVVEHEEVLNTTAGHRVFWVAKGPLRDAAGHVMGLYGIARDITDRKVAVEALRRQMELSQRYLDTVQTLMVALDRDGKITMINRAGLALLGYREEELLGADWFATCLPGQEAGDIVVPLHRQLLDGTLAGAEYFRNRVRCRDGRLRTIAWHNACLLDEAGTVVGTLSSGDDVTDLDEVQHRLEVSEERLRLALDASNDGLWDWDLATGLGYLAPNYYQMTGYAPDLVTPDLEFFRRTVHPDDWERVWATMQAHLQGATPSSEFDYRMVTAAGEIRWTRGVGRVVKRDEAGAPLRMVGIISDISADKRVAEELRGQTEELARRNAELERFNRVMVGRELDMISLKREINELSGRLGREPPYPLAFLEETAESPEAL